LQKGLQFQVLVSDLPITHMICYGKINVDSTSTNELDITCRWLDFLPLQKSVVYLVRILHDVDSNSMRFRIKILMFKY
jgi:hypothetical protein